MTEKPHLCRKWIRVYVTELAVSAAVIAAAMALGQLWGESRIWKAYDYGYPFLHFIKQHKAETILLLLLLCSVLFTILWFLQVSVGMKKLLDALEYMMQDREEEIRLPKDFGPVQERLLRLRDRMQTHIREAAEANQRKTDLIMYMAHDMKTPLTSVIGYLSLLADEKEISEQTKEKYVNIALRKALRLEDLVNEFFDITRFNFSKMLLEKSRINFSMLLQQILVEFLPDFQTKELTVSMELEEEVTLYCDANKLERVFDNLIKNMIHYSYPRTEMEVRMYRKAGQVCIRTQNSGRTIPEEMREHIFEQFFRLDHARSSKTGGAGLGLAVSKEIVELHGGRIWCESADEKIIFQIRLPQIPEGSL